MSVTDTLLENSRSYAAGFEGGLPGPPGKHVAVVACMDARLNVYAILGLQEGEAHVIRNAGGVVTDDTIRSLAISQRLLGTHEIVLIHHTGCGMLTFRDEDFAAQLQADTGATPTSTRTCSSRSPASGTARSCRTPAPSAASSSTSTPLTCARSLRPDPRRFLS